MPPLRKRLPSMRRLLPSMRRSSPRTRVLPPLAAWLLAFGCLGPACAQTPGAAENADLSRIQASPVLPLRCSTFPPNPLPANSHPGAVSGVAFARDGSLYEIRRGDKSAPVLALDPTGSILRSWTLGDYGIPHSIRVDPEGHIWTVDAASSTVIKFSPGGQPLLTLHVGGQPDNGSPFHGATDVGFGPSGHIFITDGYGNARVLEYLPDGTKLRQWGTPGSGPGQFHLPHSLQVGAHRIYIADRENGRIQIFDLAGHYKSQFPHLGRVYSIKRLGNALWASTGNPDQPPGTGGAWLVKLDARTGQILGHLTLPQPHSGHSLDVSPSGDLVLTAGDGLLWCKAR